MEMTTKGGQTIEVKRSEIAPDVITLMQFGSRIAINQADVPQLIALLRTVARQNRKG